MADSDLQPSDGGGSPPAGAEALAGAGGEVGLLSTSPLSPLPVDAVSPSLLGRREGPAYELKFLLDERLAGEIEHCLRPHLWPDPHAVRTERYGYHVTTLYCDTREFDAYRRIGRFRWCRFRLRKYGGSRQVFLERKSRHGIRVRKRRGAVAPEQLDRFKFPPADTWEGGWYHRQLYRHDLQPSCVLEYERMAYFGAGDTGPLRITFDRAIRGSLTRDWSLTPPLRPVDVFPDRVVCEFKFRGALPALLKSVMQSFQLTPGKASKCRSCLDGGGLVVPGPDAGRAPEESRDV